MTLSSLSISSFQLVWLFVGETKFQHVFAQDTLAAGVTKKLLQCRLYVTQRPGGYFLYK